MKCTTCFFVSCKRIQTRRWRACECEGLEMECFQTVPRGGAQLGEGAKGLTAKI